MWERCNSRAAGCSAQLLDKERVPAWIRHTHGSPALLVAILPTGQARGCSKWAPSGLSVPAGGWPSAPAGRRFPSGNGSSAARQAALQRSWIRSGSLPG
eukprot:9365426-Pyramimonas_sp.AAC.1